MDVWSENQAVSPPPNLLLLAFICSTNLAQILACARAGPCRVRRNQIATVGCQLTEIAVSLLKQGVVVQLLT